MASGAVALFFGLPFFEWFDPAKGLADGYSAWTTDGDAFMKTFPLATYIPLIGLVMGGQVALARFANVSLAERVLGFTWIQINLALAIFAGLLAIGWLFVGREMQFAFWLAFLGCIGLVVGAVMQLMEGEQVQQPGTPQTPF